MKKIVTILAGICLSSTAFADNSIRIINNDRFASFTIKTQICTFTNDSRQKANCVDQAPIVLPSYINKEASEQHYIDITLPNSQRDSFLHVDSVKAEWSGIVATGKYPVAKTCSGFETGDVIVLDSYATDRVICSDSNVG